MMYKNIYIYIWIMLLAIINSCYMGNYNPDYEAFKHMFLEGRSFRDFIYARDPFYNLINIIFKNLGLNYHQFRVVLLLICSLLLVLIIKTFNNLCQSRKTSNLNYFFGLFSLSIFFYEFIVIRVRGGIAILLIMYATLLIMSSKKYFILAAIIVISALGTHSLTAPMALGFFGLALLISYGNKKHLSYNFISVGCGFIFIELMALLANNGFGTISAINPIRIFFSTIIPLIIFSAILYKDVFIHEDQKIIEILTDNLAIIYLSLISGLLIAYPLGIVAISGESILRVLYIFQLPFILTILFLNSRYINLIVFITCINALFFIRPLIMIWAEFIMPILKISTPSLISFFGA